MQKHSLDALNIEVANIVTASSGTIPVDSLSSTEAGRPLSANQGRVLKNLINTKVATNVPLNALFTDTTYTVQDGELSEFNFNSTLKTKLDSLVVIDDADRATSTATQSALDLKVNITDIVDNLTSTAANLPLSAKQGKVLDTAITSINTLLASDDTTLDQMQEIVDYIKLNKTSLDSLTISGIIGLQTALDAKVDDTQVLTDVPLNALFTDTTYTNVSEFTNDAGYLTSVSAHPSDTLTDANVIDINNLSGTNTGDQDLTSFVTKTSNQSLTSDANALTISGSNVTLTRGDGTTNTVTTPNTTYVVQDGELSENNFTSLLKAKYDRLDLITITNALNLDTLVTTVGSNTAKVSNIDPALSTIRDTTTVTVVNDRGDDAILQGATSLLAGIMTADDKIKLDTMSSGGEANLVLSVAGRIGAVVLNKGDVNLGNANNTTDANKPVSIATQTALDLKVSITDIVNNLTSTSTTTPLSAQQGKILNDSVVALNTLMASDDSALDEMQELVNYIKINRSSLDNLSITAIAGLQATLDAKVDDTQVLTDVPLNALFTDTTYTNVSEFTNDAGYLTSVSAHPSDTLTDANVIDINNLSGTNTGDQDLTSFVTKTSNQSLTSDANALTISGTNLTLTRGDGTTNTVVIPDTVYTVQDGGLTEINFTTALKDKLDAIEPLATADQTGPEILTELLLVDGTTSGLDADLLDGLHANELALVNGDPLKQFEVKDAELVNEAVNIGQLQNVISKLSSPLLRIPLKNNITILNGVGAVTFTRASTATFVDRYGVVRTAAENQPRFEKEGLLLERQSTNLVTKSNDFENLWSHSGSYTYTATSGPDGSNDAVSIGGTSSSVSTLDIATNGSIHTFSVWVKGASGTVFIELNYGSGTAASKSISLTNKWTRLEVSSDTGSGNVTATITATGTTSVDLWGAQVESNEFATSIIPTDGTTITRVDDVCSVDAKDNITDNHEDVTYSFKCNTLGGSSEQVIFEKGTGLNNKVSFVNVGGPKLAVYTSNTSVNHTLTDLSMIDVKVVYKYNNGVVTTTVVVDNVVVSEADDSYANDNINYTLFIGKGVSGDNLHGHISDFRIYDSALTRTELALL